MTSLLLFGLGSALAADHAEAPGTVADVAADIADVYAWHSPSSITVAVTFAGHGLPGDPAVFDPEVLYGIHVDNDGDFLADHDIWVRFAQDSLGRWGLRVEGLPGAAGPAFKGPVETVLSSGGARAYAGLREDPFFFDFEGLVETLTTGDVSFVSTRDSFAGENVTSIVVEMDRAIASGGAPGVKIWATTGRLP